MFAVLMSAVWSGLGWLLRAVLVKFAVFTGIYLFLSEAIPYVASKIPLLSSGDGGLASVFASLGSGTWYFLDAFMFSQGVVIVLSAYVSRFVIRRIPFFG
ncbi:hypothetical protein AD940_00505 [Gluconobacter thailandicus]|uniref:DUF2523 family protein n=1 Tax=Gluconobacter thailandicus TaxID=257438 RepID=UPI000777ABAF|nr:DUF2523 family protein [Gluconobacter thailandicus]KXV36143.1 hypothetical protein AD940_00505 [Gluconobacter thailandicus]